MDRVSQYTFYELGQSLSVLRNLEEGKALAHYYVSFLLARWELEYLLKNPIGVRVSRAAIESLVEDLSALAPDEGPESDAIVGNMAATLKSSLLNLEAILKAECDSLASYIVSQKGVYSTPDLVENAENMIPEKTRALLPAGVNKDVQEAGRCLAFDLPTASGFHILRAVELVMRKLWDHVKVSTDKKPTNWGAYIERFEKADVPKKVTAMLRDIKDLYRNPTAHPEASLEEEEATTLLALGVSAIQQMAAQFPIPEVQVFVGRKSS